MLVAALRSRIAPTLLAALAVCAVQPAAARAQQRSNSPVVVVGVPDDHPPYAYLGKDGEPAGFNVDVMRAMARVMGFEVGFVPGSRAEVEEALRRGKIDVAAAMLQTEQSDAWADFSAPLLDVELSSGAPGRTTGLCFAVREGNDPLRERLDQGLETLRINGQFRKLYDEHIGIARMQQPGSPLAGWLLPMVVLFLLSMLAGFTLWLRSAPRQGSPPAA